MAETTLVTVHVDDGTQEQAGKISIPDCWHVMEWLKENEPDLQMGDGTSAWRMVLDCWHLAHSMRNHIINKDYTDELAKNLSTFANAVSDDEDDYPDWQLYHDMQKRVQSADLLLDRIRGRG